MKRPVRFSPAEVRRGQAPRTGRWAFTLIELLVVMVILAMLASLLLPTLAGALRKARGAVCINNQRQLLLAWQQYADDNHNVLVPNNPRHIWMAEPKGYGPHKRWFPSWSLGDHGYNSPDATNVDYLMGDRVGSLGRYVQSVQLFKCPGDRSRASLADGRSYPRLRSYTMNGSMGSLLAWSAGGEMFLKMGDWERFHRPGWIVFMDTHEDTMHYCTYSQARGASYGTWAAYPASRHGQAGTLGYVDGHVEMHRWVDPRTLPPVTGKFPDFQNHFGSPDYHYVWVRSFKLRFYHGYNDDF